MDAEVICGYCEDVIEPGVSLVEHLRTECTYEGHIHRIGLEREGVDIRPDAA